MAQSTSSKGPAAAERSAEDIGIEAPIPKGEVDAVYEAKARVLNAAVRRAYPGD